MTAAWLTLVLSVAVAVSSLMLPFPITGAGNDAQLWTEGMGVILAAARVQSPRQGRRAAVVQVVASAWLLALPVVNGYRPGGPPRWRGGTWCRSAGH